MAVIIGMIDSSKGKSAIAWFISKLVIWPIALVHILISDKDKNVSNSEQNKMVDNKAFEGSSKPSKQRKNVSVPFALSQ